MSYSLITSSLTAAKKALVRQFWELVQGNFSDHQSRINSLENFVTPIQTGQRVLYTAASVPTGFLECDGSAVSRTTYSALFSAIGTTYGSGDGSTTFNVPNLRDKVSLGAGSGAGLTTRTLAQSVGANTHALTTSEIPSHTHGYTDPGHTHNFSDTGTGVGATYRLVASTGSTTVDQTISAATSGLSLANSGSGTAHQNMQPYIALTVLIKT